MTRVVCPGSFDPITNGHLDIVERASFLFDEVIVVVLVNENKSGLFPIERRLELIREATTEMENVSVDSYSGLLVDYCAQNDVQAIVKGLRAVSDFDYELQMAQMNARLADVETVFVPTAPTQSYISSSLIKEVATFGGDVSGLVPDFVRERLAARLEERRRSSDQ